MPSAWMKFAGPLIDWFKHFPVAMLFYLVAIAAGFLLIRAFLRKPRLEGNWRDYLARTPHIDIGPDGFVIDPLKDWSYASEGAEGKRYTEFSAHFDDLKRIWFVVEPNGNSKLTAHTLLLFEFARDILLAVTVEARLEKEEKWTAFKGLWNRFELFYMWASARDVLLGRAVMLKHRVFVYPTELSDERMRAVLTALLETTKALETKPRFYNTFHSNCTNELGKRAGIPWHYSFVVTGKSAEYLFKRGIIPGTEFSRVRARADVTEWLKANNGLESEAFDGALLAHLRAKAEPKVLPTETENSHGSTSSP